MVTQNMQNTTTSRMHYQDKESRRASARHYAGSVRRTGSRHFLGWEKQTTKTGEKNKTGGRRGLWTSSRTPAWLNGHLHYPRPADIDKRLNDTPTDEIHEYRPDYNQLHLVSVKLFEPPYTP